MGGLILVRLHDVTPSEISRLPFSEMGRAAWQSAIGGVGKALGYWGLFGAQMDPGNDGEGYTSNGE